MQSKQLVDGEPVVDVLVRHIVEDPQADVSWRQHSLRGIRRLQLFQGHEAVVWAVDL